VLLPHQELVCLVNILGVRGLLSDDTLKLQDCPSYQILLHVAFREGESVVSESPAEDFEPESLCLLYILPVLGFANYAYVDAQNVGVLCDFSRWRLPLPVN